MVRQLLARRQEIDWAAWREETPDGLLARWEAYSRGDTLPRAAEKIARCQPRLRWWKSSRDHSADKRDHARAAMRSARVFHN